MKKMILGVLLGGLLFSMWNGVGEYHDGYVWTNWDAVKGTLFVFILLVDGYLIGKELENEYE